VLLIIALHVKPANSNQYFDNNSSQSLSDYNSNQLFSESFNNRWPFPEMQHLSTRSERAHSAPETVSELLYRVHIYNSPPVYTIMVTQPGRKLVIENYFFFKLLLKIKKITDALEL